MNPTPPPLPKLPVLSVARMREWEQVAWSASRSQSDVIQTVGRLLASRLLQITRSGDTIWILAGKGHNGDDARATQPHLHDRHVLLINATDPTAACDEFFSRLQSPETVQPRWIVDGLFGIGLNRPLDPAWQQLINALNQSAIPILAVDVPSGLDADTGQPQGAAIEAALTLTLGAPKTGLLLAPGFTGRVEVLTEIGLGPCPHSDDLNWTLPGDFAALPPRRSVDANKGDYGHLAIISGSLGYHGAAVLCARGAARAQPGLITVFPQQNAYRPVASQLQSQMVQPWVPDVPLLKTCSAILYGPGLAADDLPNTVKLEMRYLWRYCTQPMIVDASALIWLESRPTPQDAPRIITPHPGEAARLLSTTAKLIQSDRVGALRHLSKRFGDCIVALKGHQTLVGRSTGDIFVNSSGNPYMAQGGSGDLLAGYIAGLLAQPAWRADPLLAVRYAVWQHGAAADHLVETHPNWTVEDLAVTLGKINR